MRISWSRCKKWIVGILLISACNRDPADFMGICLYESRDTTNGYSVTILYCIVPKDLKNEKDSLYHELNLDWKVRVANATTRS